MSNKSEMAMADVLVEGGYGQVQAVANRVL